MRKATTLLLSFLMISGCSAAVSQQGSRLETTPRHDEWVTIARDGRSLEAYVVYPESASPVLTVVLLHENRGLTDWIREVADRLAEEGYVAIAPDFLSGLGAGGGGTSSFASQDEARSAISRLPKEQVIGDIAATVAHARTLAAANGQVAVAGFCWGGARAWDAAQKVGGLDAVFVFYGTGITTRREASTIEAPVFGFYGGDDARVTGTVAATEQAMSLADRRFVPVVYEGAGHGFLRAGAESDASVENRVAMEQAWSRWLGLLKTVAR